MHDGRKGLPVKRILPIFPLLLLLTGTAKAQAPGTSSQSIRSIGVVTTIQAGGMTLHTDTGSDLTITFAEGVSVLRVPPGALNLSAATRITMSDINSGDRVLLRGRASEDQKSIAATSVIVMSKSDLATARETERLDWQRRGISGTLQSINPDNREMTIRIQSPSATENVIQTINLILSTNTILLRYAPDSVKFSDAKSGTFDQIKVGDQIRALGTKSDDGNRFTTEKLVSGTFRDLGVTVVSIDVQTRTISATDLKSGQPVLIRTNGDSQLHRLPPAVARTLATSTGVTAPGSMKGADAGSESDDARQMVERSPSLDLTELKPGDRLIVFSTEGAKPSEVMAIEVFAGVEPILAARPSGTKDSGFGSWSLRMGGGEGGP
jgi:hypothetical protein